MADHEDYWEYSDADARAAINNIFGADGKADQHIDMDMHRITDLTNPLNFQDACTLAATLAYINAHADLPSIHHVKFTAAEARAAINNIFGSDGKADVDINLDTHKLINVVDPVTNQGGDTKKARNDAISTHAGLATVHQDAPALIETHRLAAGAHHAKYTDAEARVLHSPISINPASFMPALDTYDWDIYCNKLANRTSLTLQYFIAPVNFPSGVTVTKLTLYGFRDDALAVMRLLLRRMNRVGAQFIMADLTASWVLGYSSDFDDTITNPIINNSTNSYALLLLMNPNDSVADIIFTCAEIEFTG